MCRSIFGFVLLSACADFTVGTVATHPRSPAWHRRLRKRRQIARRRLRQHCATPADCWRIATHHGSCLPGPMTWSCPVCGTENHDNRRKCTARDCRHPGGPPSGSDNRRGTRNGSRTRTSASSASRRWTCPDCSYLNYAWRGYCNSCSRAVSLAGRGNGGWLMLKQQEISDAKSEAAEKARKVETLQARRLADVDCEGSVSHVSSSASCSAPLSPQQWALGLAASLLPEDVRVKFEEWYCSLEIEAVDTRCGDIYRFRLPCCQGSFRLSACNAICCGVSGEQESGAAAGSGSVRECRRPTVAGCRRLSGSPSPGSTRVTAGPAEQDFELCTMADFLRRVPLDELRGRGLMSGLQPEVLEQISSWPSAHAHGDELCTQLIAYTDGSACMTRAWPRLAGRGWVGSRCLCRGRVGSMEVVWRRLGASRDESRCSVVVRPAQPLRLPPSRAC